MNEVIVSGIIKGDFEDVSNDGVKFLALNKGRNGESEEFICLAYGNSASFLRQHAESGRRVVLQGRLSSEKLDTENYHTAITVSRVLSITDSSQGMDYTHAVISGLASSDGLTRLNNKNQTPLINLNVANKREYRNAEGETQEYTTYLGGTIWGRTAEAVEEAYEFPMSNVPVVFEGILKPRTYENKDGDTINKIDVWVNTINVSGQAPTSAAPAPKREERQAPRKSKPLEGSPF
jgi:single-stranded DNA-binding protein